MNATTDNIQYLQFYTNNWATKLMQEELLTQQIVKNPSKLQNFLELSCSDTQTNCKQVQYEGAKMTSALYHVLWGFGQSEFPICMARLVSEAPEQYVVS